jgi:Fe-S cluster assembly iron-binding protein IscA
MLTVTPAAAAAVATLLENPDLPEGASVRLQRGVDVAGGSAVGIAIVSGPEPDDEAVPAVEDRDVFLAPDVAELLDDQVLDAQIEEEQVSFTLRPQSVDGRQAGT